MLRPTPMHSFSLHYPNCKANRYLFPLLSCSCSVSFTTFVESHCWDHSTQSNSLRSIFSEIPRFGGFFQLTHRIIVNFLFHPSVIIKGLTIKLRTLPPAQAALSHVFVSSLLIICDKSWLITVYASIFSLVSQASLGNLHDSSCDQKKGSIYSLYCHCSEHSWRESIQWKSDLGGWMIASFWWVYFWWGCRSLTWNKYPLKKSIRDGTRTHNP